MSALPGPREKHAVGVLQILPPLGLLRVGPLRPAKTVKAPVAPTPAEVGVPCADRPVELQPLHLNIRRRVLQIQRFV